MEARHCQSNVIALRPLRVSPAMRIGRQGREIDDFGNCTARRTESAFSFTRRHRVTGYTFFSGLGDRRPSPRSLAWLRPGAAPPCLTGRSGCKIPHPLPLRGAPSPQRAPPESRDAM